jgi:hypothetical protein
VPSVELSRKEFEQRTRGRFKDAAFESLKRELDGRHGAGNDHDDLRPVP